MPPPLSVALPAPWQTNPVASPSVRAKFTRATWFHAVRPYHLSICPHQVPGTLIRHYFGSRNACGGRRTAIDTRAGFQIMPDDCSKHKRGLLPQSRSALSRPCQLLLLQLPRWSQTGCGRAQVHLQRHLCSPPHLALGLHCLALETATTCFSATKLTPDDSCGTFCRAIATSDDQRIERRFRNSQTRIRRDSNRIRASEVAANGAGVPGQKTEKLKAMGSSLHTLL